MGITGTQPILLNAQQTDIYFTTGPGTTIDTSAAPCSKYTLLVTSTGIVSAWNVVLEGSIDNVNFTPILTSTQVLGTGVNIFSGSSFSPSLYFRSNCTGLTLGLGTSITVQILGVP